MAQRTPMEELCPGLVSVVAGALALAGCGGNSASGPASDGRSVDAELNQQAGVEPAGVTLPGPSPEQPPQGAITAPAEDPAPDVAPLPPQETIVELTSETVRVGAGADVTSHPVFVAR